MDLIKLRQNLENNKSNLEKAKLRYSQTNLRQGMKTRVQRQEDKRYLLEVDKRKREVKGKIDYVNELIYKTEYPSIFNGSVSDVSIVSTPNRNKLKNRNKKFKYIGWMNE